MDKTAASVLMAWLDPELWLVTSQAIRAWREQQDITPRGQQEQ